MTDARLEEIRNHHKAALARFYGGNGLCKVTPDEDDRDDLLFEVDRLRAEHAALLCGDALVIERLQDRLDDAESTTTALLEHHKAMEAWNETLRADLRTAAGLLRDVMGCERIYSNDDSGLMVDSELYGQMLEWAEAHDTDREGT
jgi:hypothetical protein